MRPHLLIFILTLAPAIGCIYANRAPGTVAARGGDIGDTVSAAMTHCQRLEVDAGMVWGPDDRERCVRGEMGRDAWAALPQHPHEHESVYRWIGK